MGVEQSLRKKNKRISESSKNIKKNLNQIIPEKKIGKKETNILNNFQEESNISETRPQSKTVRMLYPKRESQEESTGKPRLDSIKNLKCLSVQNLVKLEKNNHNLDEVFGDSLETNCGSNKSKEEILNDEMYNDIEDNNSFEEGEEENESSEENENEIDEEKKQKELMVTNNIKTVFIDSKTLSKDINDSSVNDGSRLSTLSSTTFDYELNFYRNGNDIRRSYLAKLLTSQVWTPNMKPKQHNSIIIFDWDDTLLPTTFLTPGGIFDEDIELSNTDTEKLSKLEQSVLQLLTEAVEKGNVYIITNAGKGWVEYSANRFYPSILPILKKIKIISARGEYEKVFPGNSRQWKIEAFLNLQNTVNMKLVTNIICIGDSLFEMEAGRILASRFTEAFIKTIKFREAPKMEELLKQLKLVCLQFGSIYSSIKNLTIRVEKKKREEI